MLVLEDIAKLFELADDKHTIQLVKNKLRLECCSLILFNNVKCRELRPAVIDDMSRDPFGLWWASSVGTLPEEWNHCVGYDDHFTQGVPFFPETEGTEYVDEWRSELEASVHAESWESLMGNSVHAKHIRARLTVA
jgi:hypothetical protein